MGILDIFKKNKATIKPVDTPIEGYNMLYLFKGVPARRLGDIPEGAQIGSRVVLMYESESQYLNENFTLLLVPQRKIFGHIYNNFFVKELLRCTKYCDKSVARITFFDKKEYHYDAEIDIAFFKKTNSPCGPRKPQG